MDYALICVTAFVASGVTLLSGFGLGTILMPVFAVFFPVPTAIVLTAVVHFLNNLFKLGLVGRFAERTVIVRFGLPGVVAAFPGAWLLATLSNLPPAMRYHFAGRDISIMPVNVIVAILIVAFVLAELLPWFQRLSFEQKYLPLGGALSGFIGGLSGHQGALRSAFLIKCGLSKESFIGTGVVIACLVDVSRIAGYGTLLSLGNADKHVSLLVAATGSAFLGAYLGNRLVKKVTMRTIQVLVSILLVGIAVGLGSGLL
jgi:uncharacterized membrane protein YfcA